MVQIISDENQSIAGSLGRSFGSGIGETLPRGMERGMLSAGLKKLESQPDLTPFQQAAALYALPGGAEASQHLLPLLQQQQANKAYLNQNASESREGVSSVERPIGSKEYARKPVSSYDRAQREDYLVKRSPEEIKSIAAKEFAINPALFGHDIRKAEQKIGSEEQSRFEQDTAAEARRGKVTEDVKNYVERETQKSGKGVYAALSGATLNDFIEEAQKKTNVSPSVAAREAGKNALEFAESKQKLADIGKKSYWNKSAKDSRQAFDRIRDTYKKFGKQKEFYNELISEADLTPEVAASFAYPLKEDPKLNSFIDSKSPRTTMGRTFKAGKKSEGEIVDYLSKHPNENVSLLSIAEKLSDMGLNKSSFIEQANKAYSDDKLSLTDAQHKELQQTLSPRPSMGDLFYKSLFNRLAKNPWSRK